MATVRPVLLGAKAKTGTSKPVLKRSETPRKICGNCKNWRRALRTLGWCTSKERKQDQINYFGNNLTGWCTLTNAYSCKGCPFWSTMEESQPSVDESDQNLTIGNFGTERIKRPSIKLNIPSIRIQ